MVQKAFGGIFEVMMVQRSWKLFSVTEISEETSMASNLKELLQHCLCDTKWEVRDTAVECIAQLVKRCAGQHFTFH